MTWYEHILAALHVVTDQVSHGGRLKSTRYFVWQEESRSDYMAGGLHAEKAQSGSTDLYADDCIAWECTGVVYDPDTGFWHWEWTWEAVGDG